MSRWEAVKTAWRHFVHPVEEPEPADTTTPDAFAAFVAASKHPDTCDGTDDCGCAS
jgi:hypothetical protein